MDQEQRTAAREARFELMQQAGERNALSDEEAFAMGLALTEEVRQTRVQPSYDGSHVSFTAEVIL